MELLPFAYKIRGSAIPSEEAIYHAVQKFGQYIPANNFMNIFNCLDNDISFHTNNTFPIVTNDVLLFPLVAHIKSLAINIWQYYRMFDGLSLPVPQISDKLAITIKNGKLRLINENNKVIFKFEDFLFGLRDRTYYHSGIPYGGYLSVKTDFIESILAKQGLRLAYACKISFKTRKYSGSEEVNENDIYELINFSKIIV